MKDNESHFLHIAMFLCTLLFIAVCAILILEKINYKFDNARYKVYYEYNLNHHQSIPDANGNTEWSIDTIAIDTIYVRL